MTTDLVASEPEDEKGDERRLDAEEDGLAVGRERVVLAEAVGAIGRDGDQLEQAAEERNALGRAAAEDLEDLREFDEGRAGDDARAEDARREALEARRVAQIHLDEELVEAIGRNQAEGRQHVLEEDQGLGRERTHGDL